MKEPKTLPLPTEHEMSWAPEQAILALLDSTLLLAARTLNLNYPEGEEPFDPSHAPLVLTARSIIAMATSMRRLLAGYEHVSQCQRQIENALPSSNRRPDHPMEDDLF